LDEIWCDVAKPHADNDRNVKVKPEVEFQYGGSLFLKPEILLSQPRIELCCRYFGVQIDFDVRN